MNLQMEFWVEILQVQGIERVSWLLHVGNKCTKYEKVFLRQKWIDLT